MFHLGDGSLSAFTKGEYCFLSLLEDASPLQVREEFMSRLGFTPSEEVCGRWADRRRILHEYAIGKFIGKCKDPNHKKIEVGFAVCSRVPSLTRVFVGIVRIMGSHSLPAWSAASAHRLSRIHRASAFGKPATMYH